MSELFYHKVDITGLVKNRSLDDVPDNEAIIWETKELYTQMVSVLADLIETKKHRLYLMTISNYLSIPVTLEYKGPTSLKSVKLDIVYDTKDIWENMVIINRMFMRSRTRDRTKIAFITDNIYSAKAIDTYGYIRVYHLRKCVYNIECVLWKELSMGKNPWPCPWPLTFDQFHPVNITTKYLITLDDLNR
jgi:hypothetical protein